MKISLTKDKFLELSKKYNVISMYTDLVLDQDTPISIYIKSGAYKQDYSFILESVSGGESRGRFSIIGLDHHSIVKGKNKQFHYTENNTSHSNLKEEKLQAKDPISALEEVTRKFNFYQEDMGGFYAGSVGFFSYDSVRYYEDISNSSKKQQDSNPIDAEDMVYVFPSLIVLFDHAMGKLKIIRNIFLPSQAKSHPPQKIKRKETKDFLENLYFQGIHDINSLIHNIQSSQLTNEHQREFQNLPKPYLDMSQEMGDIQTWDANTSDEEYTNMVNKAKDYIKAGDIFQVVLSKRFSRDFSYEPFFLYRSLRATNPSPYMFYLNYPEAKVIGSSPEILVKKTDKQVLVRPIAGTIKRGQNEIEDKQLGDKLLADKKEIAEHLMLVDLGRNDVGRIAQYGTVDVTDFMYIEKYSHVMHIVSNVTGEIDSNFSGFDVLKATFPAGTVSGAPKVRAMQIIEELEKEDRGIYAGCIGYFNFNGNLDSAIALRTMILKNKKLYIQAGAGIVYDSIPENENNEIYKKSEAMFKAIELFYKGEIL